MMLENIKFSPRAYSLIKYANMYAMEYKCNSVHPIHIFLGALKMDYNLSNELKVIYQVDAKIKNSNFDSTEFKNACNEYVTLKTNNSSLINISLLTKKVLFDAKIISELHEEHGQIYVNDSHILRAIFNSDDKTTNQYLSQVDRDLLLSVTASSTDMIVDLNKQFTINGIEGVNIRKVTENDKDALREFVLINFYDRWVKTIQYGFALNDLPIYIAIIDGKPVGFAGYNISKQRKGYFGPLGVLKHYRDMKIGQALLNSCLNDMKNLGFKTCIIEHASSIEFYQKSCGAIVIPLVES